MQQLFSQLGIDWRLLLSQAVNFFIVLIVLRLVAYRPLVQLLHERRARIEEGLTKAEEADRRLAESTKVGHEKIKEAEAQAIALLKQTEDESRVLEEKLLAEAKRKEADELANAAARLRAQEEASQRAAEKDAVALVRRAIAKTVELSPEQIDDALIGRAIKEMEKGSKPSRA